MTLRLESWLSDWSRLWNLPQLPARVRVEFSTRLKRSLGRCHPVSGKIRLQTLLHERDEHRELLREVLCHEAAHVAAYLLHGRAARAHGREWAGLMAAAGFAARARMPPESLPADLAAAARPLRVYEHRCPVCGASRTAGRVVRRWRCIRCRQAGRGGRLEILPVAVGARLQ